MGDAVAVGFFKGEISFDLSFAVVDNSEGCQEAVDRDVDLL